MNTLFRLFIFFTFIGLFSSCVTIVRGVKPKKGISISGFPEDARVTINGSYIGNTPVYYNISKRETQYVEISKDGFIPQITKIETKLNPALTLASFYFGIGGFFIPTIVDLTNGSLRTIKTSNINYELRQTKNKELTRNLTSNNQHLNVAYEKNELYNEFRKRPERKEYLFKFNCDSCLLALDMYKYSYDNGMSFSSDVFDPLKAYIYSCYENNIITNQTYKCDSLNQLFSKLSKITDQSWNFSNQNMYVFHFNTKNIISDFSKAIKEQIAPDCEKCSKELTSFMKFVSKGYGEIEFNSNIILQRCIAQRKNLCSNDYFKKINSIQNKIKFPLKVVANRDQKSYDIVQEIGYLQIFKENNSYGFLNNGVLMSPPSYSSIRIVKINSNSFVYAENIEKQTLYSQYGDIVFEKNKGNIIIDEENNFIAVKSDKKWQLFLPEQLRLSAEKYDKIESINGGNLIFAWNDNQFIFINKKGSPVSDAKYDAFINDKVISNNDFIILEKSNKQGIVNSKGIEVVPFIYDKIGFNVNEYNVSDLIKGRIKVENNGKMGFINESGKELVPIKYDEIKGFGSSINNFSDDLVIVKNNGKVGLIDFEDGHLVIPILYNEIFDFKALTASSYKIAKVNKNGKYGFVNMAGEEFISPIYDEIKDFNNGYASFRINNKWGLINSLGKETINSSYDEPLSFNGNETYATLNGSKVKIDRFGNRINETPVYETKQPLVSGTLVTPAFICGTSNVSDVDGNQYITVLIGTQCWTKENLRVTKYKDGTVIPTGLDNATWSRTLSGARAIYENNNANDALYGKLYNWYAVKDVRGLCPIGWSVPTKDEWDKLVSHLGGVNAGGIMKSVTGWNAPNTGATNVSGFTGLPGGNRYNNGEFNGLSKVGGWWSSSEADVDNAWGLSLNNFFGFVHINNDYNKVEGKSVRCLKDKKPGYETQQPIYNAKQPVAETDQPDDETIQPPVSRFNYTNKQISFNEKSDVISYLEGKSFDDGTGLTIEYGYISSLNTYGIIITNINSVRYYYIDVEITTYGSFADLTGLSVNELSYGQMFGLKLYKDKVIVRGGELGGVTFYLKED